MANLIELWSKEEIIDEKSNKEYTEALWLSLQEFEQQLRDEAKGHELAFKFQQKKYQAQVQRLKEVTSFQMDMLETVVAEAKVKYAQARESL